MTGLMLEWRETFAGGFEVIVRSPVLTKERLLDLLENAARQLRYEMKEEAAGNKSVPQTCATHTAQ